MKARRYLVVAGLVAASVILLGGCTFIFNNSDWEGYVADLSITVEWGGDVSNVDLYVTYPYPADENPIDDWGTPTYGSTLDSYDGHLATGFGDDGFFPEDGTDREGVSDASGWYLESSYGAGPAVEVTQESHDGDGPETIVIREFPFDTTGASFNTSPSAENGLPAGSTYAWVGVMEVYVYAQDGQLAYSNGAGANPVITIRNAQDDIISELMTPTYADLEGASVARINLFVEKNGEKQYRFYQVLPQIERYTDDGQFRSVVGGDVETTGEVINVRGNAL